MAWFGHEKRRARSAVPPANALQMLEAFEEQAAQKYWAPEIEAEKYGRIIEQLWDDLNASTNRLDFLAKFELTTLTLSRYAASIALPHEIFLWNPAGPKQVLPLEGWKQLLRAAQLAGWDLAQCEFRHIGFTNTGAAAPGSRFYFSAHLHNSAKKERAILEGDLVLFWGGSPNNPQITAVDASQVQIRTREGSPPFREILAAEVKPPEGSYFIDPLIFWDLDHSGSGQIILAAANRVYRHGADGVWSYSALCDHDPGLIFTGALGDFSGNGTVDFLCAKFDGLYLYEGTKEGRFPDPPRQVWVAQPHLKYAQAMAVGDVDGDGDIDLFLGQYKVPYDKGQMPRPYFDANDGNPSFLLQNDGTGNFTDVTQKAGLGAKRGRRIYNASLVDLDQDGDLDLLITSDFSGIDAFRNDGSGHFKDVTTNWFPENRGLGMANCFADFNRDGRLDVMMIGMNSSTADRLASLHLNRPYDYADVGMRSSVTFGNHLLLGGKDGSFHQTELGDRVARTGWSWGCAAEDFNNDGFPDLYIANGHETRASVREYDPEFWLHDIYVGDSSDNSLAQQYFREKMSRTRGRGWSYGGYEKNRFFLNLGGTNFVECAYLMGVALEADSRNVIAEDVDGDGRLDLIVTTFEIYPAVRQTLHIFRNELPIESSLVNVPLSDLKAAGKVFPIGTRFVQPLLSTGSYRSQMEPRLRVPPSELSNVLQRLTPYRPK